MEQVLSAIRAATVPGGAVYFMQREKNAEEVISAIRQSGWTYQNLIIWKKQAAAVPCDIRSRQAVPDNCVRHERRTTPACV